ncbi:MAG: hypothetical protein HC896_18620 [Bacteroidales bacterium]|nr:hypothetical protein [Bacteroidales bacterium]
MIGASWQKLPVFFRQELFNRWHSFLKDKYKTQAALVKAWGTVLPGEDLNGGTILFAPMATATKTEASLNDANPHAIEAVQAMKQEYGPDDFPAARGHDVLQFLVDLHVSYKKRQAAAIKKLGRSTSLCPFVFDTGIGYEIQSQYLHQNADAVAHDAYVNGYGPARETLLPELDGITNEIERQRIELKIDRLAANDGPWVNWLLKPPGICQGEPWLEHNKIEGKPFWCMKHKYNSPLNTGPTFRCA